MELPVLERGRAPPWDGAASGAAATSGGRDRPPESIGVYTRVSRRCFQSLITGGFALLELRLQFMSTRDSAGRSLGATSRSTQRARWKTGRTCRRQTAYGKKLGQAALGGLRRGGRGGRSCTRNTGKSISSSIDPPFTCISSISVPFSSCRVTLFACRRTKPSL